MAEITDILSLRGLVQCTPAIDLTGFTSAPARGLILDAMSVVS